MNPNFDEILDDWSSVVNSPSRDEANELLHEEYPQLEEFLRTATLMDLSKIPSNDFGAFWVIGGPITWLTDEQFLWLLPVLLRFGCLIDDPSYSTSVINDLIEVHPFLAY